MSYVIESLGATSDNTMLYVGIGAALLLVAFSMNKAR